MGQYYNILMKEENKNTVVYNRDLIVDGKKEYTLAKLMEHSWWLNPMVNAITEKIYYADKPVQVIWMGDYATDFIQKGETFNGLTYNDICKYHNRCWSEKSRKRAIKTTEFTLDDKFLVNHTKEIYIDCTKYFKTNAMKSKYDGFEWCIHPLPLLTCIGNDLGGGDYRYPTDDSTIDLVGTWAFDKISIQDDLIPFYKEITPVFKEQGWEE